MRALRVVGITEGDGELSVVLEDPGRRERFTVSADEQLRAAARGDLTRLGQIAIELESQLRPREIQARIRAGASVEQVAAAAGVPAEKIERFAYPVLLERSRTADLAQRAHPVRSEGPDARMLGDVVAHTFGLRGQEYHEAEWDSWKGEDARWIVALSWRAGRSDNRAHWTFQPGAHGGTVTAADEHAHDLVEGLPAGPLRTVGPVIDMTRPDEPGPAPDPTSEHELRATASDATRAPWAADIGRGHAERPSTRTAPEPRRAEAPDSRRTAPAQTHRDGRTRPDVASAPVARTPADAHPAVAAARGSTVGAGRAAPPTAGDPTPSGTITDRVGGAVVNGPDGATAGVVTEAAVQTGIAAPTPGSAVRSPGNDQDSGESLTRPDAGSDAADPTTAGRRTTRKGKPVMPSWDEVLLGVRGQR